MSTKRQRMLEQIFQHGNNLNTIFGLSEDPGKLARRVYRIEQKAHQAAEDYCNGAISTDDWEEVSDKILDSLDKVLNFREKNIPVFLNGDARGYALKIEDDYMRECKVKLYSDWGGYGILAPEFDRN